MRRTEKRQPPGKKQKSFSNIQIVMREKNPRKICCDKSSGQITKDLKCSTLLSQYM